MFKAATVRFLMDLVRNAYQKHQSAFAELCVQLHMSNIHAKEAFRHVSEFAEIARG